jgi:hypothetical protein
MFCRFAPPLPHVFALMEEQYSPLLAPSPLRAVPLPGGAAGSPLPPSPPARGRLYPLQLFLVRSGQLVGRFFASLPAIAGLRLAYVLWVEMNTAGFNVV